MEDENKSWSNEDCVKCVRIRSVSGPDIPALELNTEKYFISLRIRSKCRKIRIRKTPNTDTFYAMEDADKVISWQNQQEV